MNDDQFRLSSFAIAMGVAMGVLRSQNVEIARDRARLEMEERHKADEARKQLDVVQLQLKSEQEKRLLDNAAAYTRLEAERLAAESRLAEAIEQERARAQAKKVKDWQALNRQYPIPNFLEAHIDIISADGDAATVQRQTINIGVLGNSGTGKSSLIKAMIEQLSQFGNKYVQLPSTSIEGDGTQLPARYEINGFRDSAILNIWDLPGQGTAKFPSKTYLRDMGLKYFDGVLLVTDGRWTENDGALLQAIDFACIWHCIVRTKFDQAVEDGKHDHGYTLVESFAHVRDTLLAQLPDIDPGKLHLTTTRRRYWPQFGRIDSLCEFVQEHAQHLLIEDNFDWQFVDEATSPDSVHCFMRDALFKCLDGTHQRADSLKQGSRVQGADGSELLVSYVRVHAARDRILVELSAEETGPLTVTAEHRIVVPGPTGPAETSAKDLKLGDYVLCVQGTQRLASVHQTLAYAEVVEVRFDPDEPVSVHVPPSLCILSKGQSKRRTRRGGKFRHTGSNDFPDTEYGYSD